MTDTSNHHGIVAPSGDLMVAPIRGPLRLDRSHIRDLTDPRKAGSEEAADWRNDNRHQVKRQAKRLAKVERLHVPFFHGALFGQVIKADGQRLDLGLMSLRVVTNNGVGFIVDAFQNLVELENMKYHGTGTGTNAEAAADSALQTECTTSLNPDSTRATGTTTESAANIYQTVATNTYDATVVLTEHGIFSQAATGGGVLLDRSVYSAVNLVSGDSLQTDYRLTLTAGS